MIQGTRDVMYVFFIYNKVRKMFETPSRTYVRTFVHTETIKSIFFSKTSIDFLINVRYRTYGAIVL